MDIILRTHHQRGGEGLVESSPRHTLQIVQAGCYEIDFMYKADTTTKLPTSLKVYPGAYFYIPPSFPNFGFDWKKTSKKELEFLIVSFDQIDILSQKFKLPNVVLKPSMGMYDNLIFTTSSQLSQIKDQKKDPNYFQLLSNTLLFQLFQSNPPQGSPSESPSESFLQVYIHQNIDRKIAVEELANLFGLSKFHFIRQFKKMYGLPPLQYIKKMKLQKAQNLLIQTDKNISEIAYEVGYNTLSRFSEDFKAFSQYSPSEFRASQQ